MSMVLSREYDYKGRHFKIYNGDFLGERFPRLRIYQLLFDDNNKEVGSFPLLDVSDEMASFIVGEAQKEEHILGFIRKYCDDLSDRQMDRRAKAEIEFEKFGGWMK